MRTSETFIQECYQALRAPCKNWLHVRGELSWWQRDAISQLRSNYIDCYYVDTYHGLLTTGTSGVCLSMKSTCEISIVWNCMVLSIVRQRSVGRTDEGTPRTSHPPILSHDDLQDEAYSQSVTSSEPVGRTKSTPGTSHPATVSYKWSFQSFNMYPLSNHACQMDMNKLRKRQIQSSREFDKTTCPEP